MTDSLEKSTALERTLDAIRREKETASPELWRRLVGDWQDEIAEYVRMTILTEDEATQAKQCLKKS